jgi:hypothetical protein
VIRSLGSSTRAVLLPHPRVPQEHYLSAPLLPPWDEVTGNRSLRMHFKKNIKFLNTSAISRKAFLAV